jgi:hypothetical protein
VISGFDYGLPEEGFTHTLIDIYWAKKVVTVVCLDEEARN